MLQMVRLLPLCKLPAAFLWRVLFLAGTAYVFKFTIAVIPRHLLTRHAEDEILSHR